MKHFNLKMMALAAITLGGISSADAFTFGGNNPFGKEQHGRMHRNSKHFSVDNLDARMSLENNFDRQKEAVKDPERSFKNLPIFDYLDGPDGSIWYYIAEYDYETIVHNEYWTEDVLHGFTFTIYDDAFNEIGKISDKITLDKDYTGSIETRAREVILDPNVSKNFFNTDDKYEVMVFHAINTERYVNHYYNKVYSIGGEKNEDGTDKCIMQIEGRCLEAINLSNDPSKENFLYSFVADPDITWPEDDPKYLEKLHALTYDTSIYAKADENGGPKVIFEKGVGATRISGDTTSGAYIIGKKHGDQLYYIYSYYEKPYFIDPRGGSENEDTSPDNNLTIEVYRLDGDNLTLTSTTRIPVENMLVDGILTYTFTSIGSVAWTNDIDMIVHGTPDAPAFIVDRTVVNAATVDEVMYNSFDIYGNDGKKILQLGENIGSLAVYNLPDGAQPQILFVKVDEQGNIKFDFTNLYDGKSALVIDQNNDGDELMAACSILKDVDGKLKYVFEMKYYEEDDDSNMMMRVAWYNADGTLDRIDSVNMGQDVQYATVNLDPVGLIPTLYDDDPAMEYAVLVKRTVPGGTTRNEFMVVDDNDELYAKFTADDGKGTPLEFTIIPGTPNRLMMVYDNGKTRNIDLYDLPFLSSGINGIEDSIAAGNTSISYNGYAVYAPQAKIEIYSTNGVKEAEGFNSVSVESLSNGVYVVVATDSNGAKKAVKIRK